MKRFKIIWSEQTNFAEACELVSTTVEAETPEKAAQNLVYKWGYGITPDVSEIDKGCHHFYVLQPESSESRRMFIAVGLIVEVAI